MKNGRAPFDLSQESGQASDGSAGACLEQAAISPATRRQPSPLSLFSVCRCGSSLLPCQTRLPSRVTTMVRKLVPGTFRTFLPRICTALLFHLASKQIIHALLANKVTANFMGRFFLSPLESKPLSDVSALLFLWASLCASSISDLSWGSGLASLLVLCPQCSFWLMSSTPGGSSACFLHVGGLPPASRAQRVPCGPLTFPVYPTVPF